MTWFGVFSSSLLTSDWTKAHDCPRWLYAIENIFLGTQTHKYFACILWNELCVFHSVHWKAIDWSTTLAIKDFLYQNTSVLTRNMSAGLSFRTKRKLLSSLRYPFPWKLAATALQIRISLRFCDCGSLCNNAVLHLFFLLGTLNEKSMEKPELQELM